MLFCAALGTYTKCVQYRIRRVPPAIDKALREQARRAGKSLNEAALDALAAGIGIAAILPKRRDLSVVAGTWKLEKAVLNAFAAQDLVDEDLWH
jgi:hypothetical protein